MRSEDYQLLYDLEDDFWWFQGMREITAALLDPFYPSGEQTRLVLDAGCGTGGNLSSLESYSGRRVIGIDLAEEALSFCAASQHQLLACASVTELPFSDSVFDLVTSFDVLGQLSSPGNDENALREMYRVLRPGGIAFIRVAAYEWMHSDHDDAIQNSRRYDLATLVQLVTSAGFHPLRATYANTLLLPAAMLWRLVVKPMGLGGQGSEVKPLSPRLQWLNRVMTGVLSKEAQWLKRPHTKLRAGLSAICISEKPL